MVEIIVEGEGEVVCEVTSEWGGGHGCANENEKDDMMVDMMICDDCFEKLRRRTVEECLKCRYEEQVAVVGSDVVALFPSLQERNTGKIVAKEVRLCDLKFEGMNYQMIDQYRSDRGPERLVESIAMEKEIRRDRARDEKCPHKF